MKKHLSIAAVVFLAAPMALTPLLRFFPDLLPKSQEQTDVESAQQETDFLQKADAEALAALPGGKKPSSRLGTKKVLYLRRYVPELCCPGVRVPRLKEEATIGDWQIALHYLTTANLDSTVRYYEQTFGSKALTPPPTASGPVIWRVNGQVRGIKISARIADIPHRGVCVVIF